MYDPHDPPGSKMLNPVGFQQATALKKRRSRL
jgi:hypothetical protein